MPCVMSCLMINVKNINADITREALFASRPASARKTARLFRPLRSPSQNRYSSLHKLLKNFGLCAGAFKRLSGNNKSLRICGVRKSNSSGKQTQEQNIQVRAPPKKWMTTAWVVRPYAVKLKLKPLLLDVTHLSIT